MTKISYRSNLQSKPTNKLNCTIHFDLLESILKNLMQKFTTILFTKLNYREIFASPATIPLYKIENYLQTCLNIARLHLYLINKYQLINYIKFNKDFKLRPKRFKINSKIKSLDQETQYFKISSDL